jgi:hypothetical protein
MIMRVRVTLPEERGIFTLQLYLFDCFRRGISSCQLAFFEWFRSTVYYPLSDAARFPDQAVT